MRLYRVETLSGELGFPVDRATAIEQATRRLPKVDPGDSLRIRAVEYRLDPGEPFTIHTRPMLRVWRGTVLKFPDIGSLGVYVCKPLQHRFGNAGDWGAPPSADTTAEVVAYISEVAEWQRRRGMAFEDGESDGLPVSEVIVRDRIATRAQGWAWRLYTGTLHAAHVHSSCYPLIDPGLPCGQV